MSSDSHNYDGIEEHDNPLPIWWLVTFFATIIFAFVYFIHYMFGGGVSLQQEFTDQMKALPNIAEKLWTEDELKGPFSSPENLSSGRALFLGKCAACHGNEGQGSIGANLTDKFWIHGGTRKDIIQLIQSGVVSKGMPTWSGVLSDSELISVASYVYSLRQSPKIGKQAEGQEIKE